MATVHSPDLILHPQVDGGAQADTGLVRATLAQDLSADSLVRVEIAQKVLQHAAGVLAWIDRQGHAQVIASIASASLEVDGSTGRFRPVGAPYEVAYTIEGDRVKRQVVLTAPLPDPDPEVFPDLDSVYLSLLGPLTVDPTLTVLVDGQAFTPGQDLWTAGEVLLVDAAGRTVEKLARIWAKDSEGNPTAGRYRLTTDPVSGQLQVYETIPYWWLRTLSAEHYPVVIDPTVVATSTSASATAYNSQRKLDRCQNGNLWLAVKDGSGNTKFYYSVDEGQTWSHAIASDIASDSSGSLFIDVDDFAHYVYGSQYVRGTPDAGRTNWSWSAPVTLDPNAASFGDIVAHREADGWVAHTVYCFRGSSVTYLYYRRILIASDGTITLDSIQQMGTEIDETLYIYPIIDFNHTGDGKTVAGGTPHVFVMWSARSSADGSYGPWFRKATYSGGTWSWGTARDVDSTNRPPSNKQIAAYFDGTRVVLAYPKASDTTAIEVLERDAADTTTTQRTPPALNDGTVTNVGLGYDGDGNIYLFAVGANSGDVKRCKYDRAAGQWGTWETLAAATATADSLTVRRGYSGNAIDVAWSNGSASPYQVQFERIALNSAPSEPTITVSPAAFDAASGTDVTVTHNDPDGDQMSAYTLKRVLGTSNEWWRASDKTWVASETWNSATGTSVTIPAADNAGKWQTGQSYQLYAATKDDKGLAGPYNSTGVTANAGAKPVAQITSPGATLSQQKATVHWTTDQPQGAYQVRLKDSGGAVLEDTGKVQSTSARAREMQTTLNNNAAYTVELTVWDQTAGGGVQSDPVAQATTTSFTPPLAPLYVSATPNSDAARIDLQWLRGIYQTATFSRNSTAYNPETGAEVASGTPRYRTARFGQGLMVEEGTTNLLPAGSKDFQTGWQAVDGATVTVTAGQADPFGGAAAYRVQTSGGTTTFKYRCSAGTSTAGQTYSGQVWVRPRTTVIVSINLGENVVLQPGDWQLVKLENRLGNGINILQLLFMTQNSADSLDCDVMWPGIEAKPYCTSYTPPGTTRAAESASISTEGLDPKNGCWRQWVYVNDIVRRQIAGQFPGVFYIEKAAGVESRGIALYHRDTADTWSLAIFGDDDAATAVTFDGSGLADGWHLFEVKWRTGEAKVLVDGVVMGTITDPNLPSAFGDNAYIGRHHGFYLNSIHDDIHVLSVYPSDAESAAAYSSGEPAAWDQYTVVLLPFDATLESGNQNSTFGDSWRVERRKSGESAWTSLATVANPSSGTWAQYSDNAAASGTAYEYRVVAIGSNTTEQAGDPVTSAVTFESWRFVPIGEEDNAVAFRYDWSASRRLDADRVEVQARGRYPITFRGPRQVQRISLTAVFPEDAGLTAREWAARLYDLSARGVTGYLKSPWGDAWRGELHSPSDEWRRDLVLNPHVVRLEFVEKGPVP